MQSRINNNNYYYTTVTTDVFKCSKGKLIKKKNYINTFYRPADTRALM